MASHTLDDRRRRKFGGACAALVLLAGLQQPALAQTAGELAVARRLFDEAAALQEQKRWALAAEKLREAIKIKDTPGLRYHLAHCEEQLGRLVEAQLDYDRAAELIRAGAHAPDVEVLLEDARTSLSRRVPSVTVELTADVPVERFILDDRNLVVTLVGKPIPLDPGEHRLRVEARGYQPFEKTVNLTVGTRETVPVTLVPAEVVEEQPEVAVDGFARGRKSSEGWGAKEYVLLGEGVFTAASLGFGIAATLQRSQASSDQTEAERLIAQADAGPGDSSCRAPSSVLVEPCADLARASDDVRRWTTLLFVGYAGAAAGGIALLVTALAWDEPSSERPVASLDVLSGPNGQHGFVYSVSGRF